VGDVAAGSWRKLTWLAGEAGRLIYYDPDPTLAQMEMLRCSGACGKADRRVASPADSELFLMVAHPKGEFADANDRSWPLIMTHLVTLPGC
jgi:hypothetical protein